MKILIAPFIAAVIAQFSKLFVKSNKQKLSWSTLWAYSGMPSGHASMTVALTTIIGLEKGLDYPGFAVALVFTILVIRDAVGLRQQLGSQGSVLNELVDDLDEDNFLDRHYPQLLEKIGHTPIQIIVGSLVGAIVAMVIHYFF